MQVCTSGTTTLSDTAAGGVWSSSDTVVAIIDSNTGVVTGITPGIVTISHDVSGIISTTSVTVNPTPAPISGPDYFHCPGGASSIYVESITGGTWSSSDTAVATMDSLTGIVTPISLGAINITYTLTGGCYVTKSISNLIPSLIITGPDSMCEGTSATCSWLPECIWFSSDPLVAPIDSFSGSVTGLSTGSATIYASMGPGCTVSKIVTVNPLPYAGYISGPSVICLDSSITLTESTTGGSWSELNANATVLGGIVTGVTAGADTIIYTVINSCGSASASAIVNAFPSPDAGTITGLAEVCESSTITLSDTSAGGIWSSGTPGTATVSTSGLVTGVAAGTVTITYTSITGCGSAFVTNTITVNPLPYTAGITGLSSVCIGSSITLSDVTPGGIWLAYNGNATIVSGLLTGVAAGADTINYVVTNMCGSAVASKIITIIPFPVAPPISGLSSVCETATILLTDSISGGTWYSMYGNATISGGLVTGIYHGYDTITYTVTNACGFAVTTKAITVNPAPFAGNITGANIVCIGSTLTLTDTTTGGIWSSSNGNATIASGLVTGVTVGTDSIRYSVTNVCGTATTSKVISINPLPVAFTITGGGGVCAGSAGVSIGLNGSEPWLNYQLYRSSTAVGAPVAGTGATLDFGLFTTFGSYTIRANSTATGCSNNMTGSDSVYSKSPVVPAVTITAAQGTHIMVGTYDTLTANVTSGGLAPAYQWYINGNPVYSATNRKYYSNSFFNGDSVACVVTNSDDCGTSSSGHIIITTYSTGIETIAAPSSLSLYPNPNKGTFSFALNSAVNEPVHVSVTNLLGQKLKDLIVNTNTLTQISLEASAGIYFITAETTNGSLKAKFIVE